MKKKEIRVRCWIDINGTRFFGPGRSDLLKLIDETGSIAKAARTMGMSYKKAWDMVGEMNMKGKTPLVISQKGGSKGGGASLTETGKKVVLAYDRLAKKLNTVVSKESALLKLI